jgi:hypothetical protein
VIKLGRKDRQRFIFSGSDSGQVVAGVKGFGCVLPARIHWAQMWFRLYLRLYWLFYGHICCSSRPHWHTAWLQWHHVVIFGGTKHPMLAAGAFRPNLCCVVRTLSIATTMLPLAAMYAAAACSRCSLRPCMFTCRGAKRCMFDRQYRCVWLCMHGCDRMVLSGPVPSLYVAAAWCFRPWA